MVWDLASFAYTAAEKKMLDVDLQKLHSLFVEAAEKLGQKISDVERMIHSYSELDIRDAWTISALKSTPVFEILQLRPDDVKELEKLFDNDLSSVEEVADFLNEKLEPFEKLHDLVGTLEMEI